jgi:hypothetical protein
MPPAAATSATATALHADSAPSIRRPGAKASCSIPQQAKPNASTAEVVCTKSGQVNSGPYGTGQPGVQVT